MAKQKQIKKVTFESLKKELHLDDSQRQKIEYILNKIYNEGIFDELHVINAVREILELTPRLTNLDDIYILGWKGYPEIEYRYTLIPKRLIEEGVIKTADAYIVREGEKFEVNIENSKTEIKHSFNPFNTKNKPIGVYARAVLPDGDVVLAFASWDEINEAKKMAKIKSKGKKTAWDSWEIEMAKKVPLKRLVKLIPIPNSIEKIIEQDNKKYPTLDEIRENEKIENTYSAIEELNEMAEPKDKNETEVKTVSDYLKENNIPYEEKAGYVKVLKNDISEELAKKLGLKETSKVKDAYIGKNVTIN